MPCGEKPCVPGTGHVLEPWRRRRPLEATAPWAEPRTAMTDLAATDDLFFSRTGMERSRVEARLGEALAGMDDGELFLEYCQSENVALDDGKIKSAAFDTTQGFGLRAVSGEATGYAHASEISEAAIRRAATAVRAVAS